MKTLIVYFSLSGNTKWLAEQIREEMPDADLHEIRLFHKPLKSKFWQNFIYGFNMIFNKDMPIETNPVNLNKYDNVIIGSPVWIGKTPPPIRQFLRENNLSKKKVAAFATCGGDVNQPFFKHLNQFVDAPFTATLLLKEPFTNSQKPDYEKIKQYISKLKKDWLELSENNNS